MLGAGVRLTLEDALDPIIFHAASFPHLTGTFAAFMAVFGSNNAKFRNEKVRIKVRIK